MVFISEKLTRLHDRKTEHFKALINGYHTSAPADHQLHQLPDHSLKWDHFEERAIRHSL